MVDVNMSLGSSGFLGLLTLIFITLKLCEIIDWSWWWVLSPLWISVGLGVLVTLIVLISMIRFSTW